ncbi:hypothetical protein RM780_26370 [Streptomyces sp. DSM 44917]|uniref:Transcriptional regulator n=1 Tax=Streptomyces boetiae TaxID=3075541 RepID=A0ABU2LFT3_9ACTN|nr:hypothetical protein [Streptomyces sp. DSM 44917]MDT0310446.1 hypothetical protein [Streptomyces sp. DSM 44917]
MAWKLAYLREQAGRFGGGTASLSRAFCIPEEVVTRSPRYERVLLFLAVTLMELHGIRVWVTARPEYSAVDGFALVPGRRAVLANWVRTEALWQVDAVAGRAQLRSYLEISHDVRGQSVVEGADPETRLRALAAYLCLDWPWLVRRCGELGETGVAGVVRPRSRLLGVEAVDDVLHFLGKLPGDR